MATVLPEETSHFRCLWGYLFPPTVTPPTGSKSVSWVYPDSFFKNWQHDSVPEQRPYFWYEFLRQIVPILEPVKIAEIPKRQFVYGWEAKAPIRWRDVYGRIPSEFRRGNLSRPFQPVPYYRLPQLLRGWPEFEISDETGKSPEKVNGPDRPLIPKTETGALLYLGNQGSIHTTIMGTFEAGADRQLVHAGFYSQLRHLEWNFNVPAKEKCDDFCPQDLLIITVRS